MVCRLHCSYHHVLSILRNITMLITRVIRSVLHQNSPTPSANYTKKRYANLYNESTLVSENITFPLPVQYKEVYLPCRTKMLSQTIVGNTIFMIISCIIGCAKNKVYRKTEN